VKRSHPKAVGIKVVALLTRSGRLIPLAAAVLCCLMGLLAPVMVHSADVNGLTETQVKAAFTFRFLSYVNWPANRLADDDSPLVIGIIGSDEIFDIESHIAAARKIGSHPILVRKLDADDPLSSVHAVYVTGVSVRELFNILARAQSNSVLVITDAESAMGKGAEIALTTIEGKVRFLVDLDAAARANLRLGSGMLSVAVKVIGSP